MQELYSGVGVETGPNTFNPGASINLMERQLFFGNSSGSKTYVDAPRTEWNLNGHASSGCI